MKPYRMTIAQVIEAVQTNPSAGLTDAQVIKHHKQYGYNVLPDPKRRTIFSIFFSQFQSPLIYILLCAAVLIFIVGEDKLDAFIISGVLFFNAILGTVQEARTKNIVESLKRLITTESIVLRNGEKIIIKDQDVVVGDIIFLQGGQRVPADARIIESNNCVVDESVLTGESKPVRKSIESIDRDVPIGDQSNMLFKGTYVVTGSGKAIVVAIGQKSEIGKIHRTVEEIDTDIPLRRELDHLSYIILIFILGFCVSLFVIGIMGGKPIKELFVMLTALFICVIPEGLPVVLTLVLVSGAFAMAKRFVLVKNMQSVEALGRTNVIVIDKTGTLTRNEMIVSSVHADDAFWYVTGQGYHAEGNIVRNGTIMKEFDYNSGLGYAAIASSLLNSAEIVYDLKLDLFDVTGDPTEAALYVFSKKLGLVKKELEAEYKKIDEIPFDSVFRYHAGLYQKNDEYFVFIIGAPEKIIALSTDVSGTVREALDTFLHEGLRVVACGMRKISLDEIKSNENNVQNLINQGNITFLAMCGIEDSIRSEVGSIVEQARDAGLSIVMATGDHQATALYVAKKVGIYKAGDDIIDGPEFERLSDEELRKRFPHVTVFSRVSPEHKMRIITIFHTLGKIVAMTGDGVNDAPSLVAADLGIAMGRIGTEVAKAASDLILMNDSFVTIVEAIEQGRHIFYTLKRIILYFFATNMGEILIILFAFLLSIFNGYDLPLPITAAQILWLNLVTDGFLDIGLSMEPKEPGLLKRFWLEKKQRLIDGALLLKMMYMAMPMGIGSLWIFMHYYQEDLVHARTMTLVTMAMFQWFNAWNCRSTTRSLLHVGLFTNKLLIAATLFVLALQFVLLHVPFMQFIFKTVPLSFTDWMVIISVSAPILLIEELRKAVVRRWL